MGLFDRLKALGDPRSVFESVITTQAKVLERMRRQHPGRDLNAWLALTLASRRSFRGKPEIYYLKQTAVLSLVPGEAAIRGLGLYVLLKEASDRGIPEQVLAIINSYETEFDNIFDSALRLPADTLRDRWATMNPWTAEHYPDVEVSPDFIA